MVRKVVSEIVSYVNADLLERNAARFLPGLSRCLSPEGKGEYGILRSSSPTITFQRRAA